MAPALAFPVHHNGNVHVFVRAYAVARPSWRTFDWLGLIKSAMPWSASSIAISAATPLWTNNHCCCEGRCWSGIDTVAEPLFARHPEITPLADGFYPTDPQSLSTGAAEI